MAPLDFERELKFDGCFNFRDLGGYRTQGGQWTRPQRLYRADGPHALTESDAARLSGLALATIIDLRNPDEVERGCYTAMVPDVVEYHLPMADVLPSTEDLPSWVDPAVVADRYRDMLDAGRDTIIEVLAILSDPSAYPAMFHCSAGKDRTGIVAAVLLGLLGVPDETIVADYALSGTPMHRLVAYYKSAYPDAVVQLTRLAPAMISAHPQAMAGLIAGLRRDYGSFDEYANAIGVGTAPTFLRARVLT